MLDDIFQYVLSSKTEYQWEDFAGTIDPRHAENYSRARQLYIENPESLIDNEQFISNALVDAINARKDNIKDDYNYASTSAAAQAWWPYRPSDRGRKPIGDQVPWGEIGEHAILSHVVAHLLQIYNLSYPTYPFGSDRRFLLRATTKTIYVSLDGKSCGPRDDAPCVVLSRNQVSGDGVLTNCIENSKILAEGARTSHTFQPTQPPLFFHNDIFVPHVTVAIKPVYSMGAGNGQPLDKIIVAVIPNGLLLTKLLRENPGLFYPGKDGNIDKSRARLDLTCLATFDPWRVTTIIF